MMVGASLLMGGIALLGKYASRVALSFVLAGNGILAFLWYFNGAYHDVVDDRTASIHWAYEWDTKDPLDRIIEKFRPGSVSKHGAIFLPPAIGQNGTIYLLRPHDFTDPNGLSLEAFNPKWLWELRPKGGICTAPAMRTTGPFCSEPALTITPVQELSIRGRVLCGLFRPRVRRNGLTNFRLPPFFTPGTLAVGVVFPANSPACSQPAVAGGRDLLLAGPRCLCARERRHRALGV